MRLAFLPIGILLLCGGCITVQPSDEPIHIIVDVNVNVKIDQELDRFFDFDESSKEPTP